MGRPRFFRQGFPSAALAAAVSAGATLAASQRRRLAVGQVEDADLPALLDQPDDRAAHAQLGIIRMRGDDERIERLRRLGVIRTVWNRPRCSSLRSHDASSRSLLSRLDQVERVRDAPEHTALHLDHLDGRKMISLIRGPTAILEQ